MKSIINTAHRADCVNWVPRLTLLDLQTGLMNELSEHVCVGTCCIKIGFRDPEGRCLEAAATLCANMTPMSSHWLHLLVMSRLQKNQRAILLF